MSKVEIAIAGSLAWVVITLLLILVTKMSNAKQTLRTAKRIEENRAIDEDRKKELIKQIFDKEEKLLTLFLKRADKILRKD